MPLLHPESYEENVTSTSNEKEDFYPILLDNNIYRIVCLTLSFFSITVGTLFIYTVIWFEKFGSDKKRTILNLLFSMNNYIIILFLWFIQIPETSRYIHGPLPFFICYGQQVFRNFFIMSMVLFADAVTVSRYAFIFWLKNPAAFNDDFWYCFIAVWIFGFSTILCCISHCLGSYHDFALNICTGQVSKVLPNSGPTVGSVFLMVFSFLIHTIAYTKIYFYKKKPNSQPLSQSCLAKSVVLTQLEEMTLSSFATSLIFLMVIVISLLNYSKLRDITPSNFNKYPYYLSAYFRSFGVAAIAVLIIIFWFMSKNKFRQVISSELKSLRNEFRQRNQISTFG